MHKESKLKAVTISDVSESYMCCNCGACQSVCPVEAISFQTNILGRVWADIDKDKCISCGLCRKVCPTVNAGKFVADFYNPYVGEIRSVYVGRCSDEKIFENSQSGGACTAVLKYLFTHKLIDAAIVTIMKAGNPPDVHAKVVDSVEQLYQSQRSCYTPVTLLSALTETEQYNSVALVGLPCHMEGLELFSRLGKSKNIKYRLGLICDRTQSGAIQNVVCNQAHISPNYEIVWRNKKIQTKKYSYANAPLTISSSDGKMSVMDNSIRFLLKDMFTPPRCRVCFDKINVFADVVFGDPWRMPDVDLKNGESLILTRTELGQSLIANMIKNGDLILNQRPIEQALSGQLIKERVAQCNNWARVLQSNKITATTYINSLIIDNIEPSSMTESTKQLEDYLEMDKAENINEILERAENEIRRRHKQEKQEKSCFYVFLRKSRSLIRILKSKL